MTDKVQDYVNEVLSGFRAELEAEDQELLGDIPRDLVRRCVTAMAQCRPMRVSFADMEVKIQPTESYLKHLAAAALKVARTDA